MENFMPTIAIVTFTDDRDVGVSSPEVENYLKRKQSELKNYLARNGVNIIDPLAELRNSSDDWYGLRNLQDINNIVSILSKYTIDGIIIGAWTWSPPMLIMEFVRKIAKPFMYYTENNPLQGNLSQFSAACSSLMEWGINKHALTHERNFGNKHLS
ncbi:MAG: hypothetical protein M1365_07020, partial [Actinobacteria bacterium]|nr:hypothetical protein [Actinomycetota bacterium]